MHLGFFQHILSARTWWEKQKKQIIIHLVWQKNVHSAYTRFFTRNHWSGSTVCQFLDVMFAVLILIILSTDNDVHIQVTKFNAITNHNSETTDNGAKDELVNMKMWMHLQSPKIIKDRKICFTKACTRLAYKARNLYLIPKLCCCIRKDKHV